MSFGIWMLVVPLPWLIMSFILVVLLMVTQAFDVWFLLRITVGHVVWEREDKKELLEVSSLITFCSTTDIDCHSRVMSPARAARECEIALVKLWATNGVSRVLKDFGARLLVSATLTRYRRPVVPFDRVKIMSKVLCWDENSFYVEQVILQMKDSSTCALFYCKQTIIGSIGTKDVLNRLYYGHKVKGPRFPSRIQKWIECDAACRGRLRSKPSLTSQTSSRTGSLARNISRRRSVWKSGSLTSVESSRSKEVRSRQRFSQTACET